MMEYTETKKKNKLSTRSIIYVGMFAAVMAVLSQCAIPMPSGVPVTLQIFGVALIGMIMGWKLGLASLAVFILVGAVGAPVFSSFRGGFQVLVGATGGFIWGYLPMVALCGTKWNQKNKLVGTGFGILGLLICYVCGAMQYMFLMKMTFVEAFLLVGAPYLLKDIVLVVIAYVVGSQIRKRLLKANLL